MTPQQAISMLDRQIAAHGQAIRLRRGSKDSPVMTLSLNAVARGYKPSDIVPGSGVSQKDTKVIVSPTDLITWPSPLPKEGDWCEIDGQFRSIIGSTAVKISNTAVRVELQVKG